jgi:hypothetical protein
MKAAAIVLCAAIALMVTPAGAADIWFVLAQDALYAETGDPGKRHGAVVMVRGTMLPGDGQKFLALTASTTTALVEFESDGGSLAAGIEIGRAIRLKGFTTFVGYSTDPSKRIVDQATGVVHPVDLRCASACAVAWLGGVKRFLSPGALIGFHAASVAGLETGLGNALLGAYLNQLGLPDIAVAYITYAAPQSITWLNFEDAKKVGIDVQVFVPRIVWEPNDKRIPACEWPVECKARGIPTPPSFGAQ